MKLSIISLEHVFPGESELLTAFFQKEIEHIYIRKPNSTEQEIRDMINKIPEEYHHRIIVQNHFNLIRQFNLNGVLLSRRFPVAPNMEKSKGITKAVACSRVEDLGKYINFQNILFGPLFDPSSSSMLKNGFSLEKLREAKERNVINSKVVAMGGICTETILFAKSIGFERVATWSSLWGNYSKDKDKFVVLKRLDEMIHATEA